MGEPQFYRDTWVEINLDNLAHNINEIKSGLCSGTDIIAVVKANGYGHGDFQVSKAALKAGANKLAVSLLDEALSLRRKGITAPILLLGASRPEDVRLAVENDIILTVFQKEWLRDALQYLRKSDQLRLQIKLDSGMGRIGIRTEEELVAVETIIHQDDRLILEGVFTHFATADEKNLSYFHEQISRFNNLLASMTSKPTYVHCGNSAAALRFPDTHLSAIRLGIAMYGMSPSETVTAAGNSVLKETFTLYTKLIQVKKLTAKEKVSYGATYESKTDEWIGTIPIGYADGWLRSLSGQEVIIDGQRVPIVGKICMDQCMIKLPTYYPVGTKVTLIGTEKNETITIDEIARKIGTINYEIPCIISSRVPRVYRRNGKTEETNNPVLK